MTKWEIKNLSTRALKSLVWTTNRLGKFAQELEWAKEELRRRKARQFEIIWLHGNVY
jgi:hypothetical protein